LGYSSSLVFYSHSLHSPYFPYQTAAFRVKLHTIEYCFRKAGYGHGQLSGVSDVVMRNEDDDDAFQHDWQKFTGMDNQKCDDYVSVDSHLVTNGVIMVQQLRESRVGASLLEGAEEDGEDTEHEVVLNFAEAHKVLMKVKSFVNACSNSDGDRDSVLSLESSSFELSCKVSTKQLSITEFFSEGLAVLMKSCIM
jgi:hypothetical protein